MIDFRSFFLLNSLSREFLCVKSRFRCSSKVFSTVRVGTDLRILLFIFMFVMCFPSVLRTKEPLSLLRYLRNQLDIHCCVTAGLHTCMSFLRKTHSPEYNVDLHFIQILSVLGFEVFLCLHRALTIYTWLLPWFSQTVSHILIHKFSHCAWPC